MKKLLLSLVLIIFTMACASDTWDEGEVRDYNGEKVVIIKDDDGSDIFINYLIYQSLINQGYDYGQIRSYHHDQYRSNPNYINQYNIIKQKTVTIQPKIVDRVRVRMTTPTTTTTTSASKPSTTTSKPSTTISRPSSSSSRK